jgi:L-threonylcarbamoyladenylate synthase
MIDQETDEIIERAVETLKQGGILLAPTDTVWGLMCDFSSEGAVASIYEIKKSARKPLAILIDSLNNIDILKVDVPANAKAIAEAYWPGPLTLIFKSGHEGIGHISGEGNTIGIRIPDSEELRRIIELFGGPIAATSANISGQKQPESFDDIPDEIAMSADYICRLKTEPSGKASTVVDCTGNVMKIMREGEISMQKLEQAVSR